MKNERELFEIKDPGNMWILKEMLDIKETKCCYCDKGIKKGDKFCIFNKPTRLVCDSPMCIFEYMEEDDKIELELSGEMLVELQNRVDEIDKNNVISTEQLKKNLFGVRCE